MKFPNPEVEAAYAAFPPQKKEVLLTIRNWIFEVAENTEGVGRIEECLKWGEPSFLTLSPKSGSTLRLSGMKKSPSEYGLFVHCQTGLVEEFQIVYPDFKYDKTRGVIFDINQPMEINAIKQFIYLALTYHSRRN